MPYYISNKQNDCSGWATIKIENNDTTTIGCHKTKSDAIKHMVAISLAEKMKPGGEYGKRAKYNPPSGVAVAAKRALKWIAEGKAGSGFTDVGRRRAVQLASGQAVSADVVMRMKSYFARHETDKKAVGFSSGEEGYPSPGRVAWDAWGGDAGQSWVNGLKDFRDLSVDNDKLFVMNFDNVDKQGNAMFDAQVRAVSRAEKILTRLNKVNDFAPASETRISTVDFEIRAIEDKLNFSGYAAVFNSDSQPLPFIERIAPGAFKRSLQSRNDVKLLWNHDAGEVLASTRAGTMRLFEDSMGLRVEADLAPTTRGKDLSILMQRGDINKMSFAFKVQKDSWSSDGQVRTLESVRLLEVSIVTWPAYEASDAQVRSIDNIDVDDLSDALLALETQSSLSKEQALLLTNVIEKFTDKSSDSVVESDVVEPDIVEVKPIIDLMLKKHELEGKML